jgi:hypothetical protein
MCRPRVDFGQHALHVERRIDVLTDCDGRLELRKLTIVDDQRREVLQRRGQFEQEHAHGGAASVGQPRRMNWRRRKPLAVSIAK